MNYLYQADLLEGQVITVWFERKSQNLNPKFKSKMTKLIDFLLQSSDEDESDED